MPQSKRFGKPFSSLFSVAAFGTRSRQKLSASILLALAAASVSTAAHALTIEVFVNGKSALLQGNDNTAGPTDPGPYALNLPASGTLNGTFCSAIAPTECVNIASGKVTATVTNLSATSPTIATSSSITTKVNVSGNFKYLGSLATGGTLEIVTSNKFALASGVWTTSGKGGSKVCNKNANPTGCLTSSGANYVASATCIPNSNTIQSGACTFGRSYNATDEGYVYRIVSGAQRPAGGVSVKLSSDVVFFDTTGNPVRTEIVGGQPPANPASTAPNAVPFGPIPLNSTYQEDAHFYLGTSVGGAAGETIPCEPLNTSGGSSFTCQNSERKISRLLFTNLNANDLVNLPVTSTDLGASDPGTLAINLNAKVLVDVQPLAVVANANPDTQGFHPFLGDANNDWNPTKVSGKRQVLMLNSYTGDGTTLNVDVCNDVQFQDVSISVAGSEQRVGAESGVEAIQDGKCIGKVFVFNYATVNPSIPGETPEAKLATCFANPTVTLFASGVPLSSEYDVDRTQQQGGKPTAFLPPPGCQPLDENTLRCTVNTEVEGSQLVRCCTSCG